jgi:ATP-dependent Lon protease
MAELDSDDTPNLLVAVLPLPDMCLFPEASLVQLVARPGSQRALGVAARTGGRLLALGCRDGGPLGPRVNDFHGLGTLAHVSEDLELPGGTHRVELDGVQRARVVTLLGADSFVAELETLDEGDTGDEWGPAVEALARYMHAHPDLRSFLDQQRRSRDPMAWVNLACQHLPITFSARQKLLEAPAAERCLKISRGLDALLRKEKAAEE